ncbi:unnamed protein product, partial [Meganyctiphanes norvegica]
MGAFVETLHSSIYLVVCPSFKKSCCMRSSSSFRNSHTPTEEITKDVCKKFIMLSSMVKEHQVKQHARKEEQAKKQNKAVAHLSLLSQILILLLIVCVAQAYLNQKRLDSEASQLEQSATSFQRQTHHWLGLVASFADALKEVGHVQNWASTIETDMKTISTALEYAYKVEQQASSSG